MNLKFKNVNKEKKNIKRVDKIYEESFTQDERYRFKFLLKAAKRKDNLFYVIYDNYSLIGLTYLTFEENNIFILYLAINNKYQNQGYGTAILTALKEKYLGYNFILDIESIKKSAPNYEQRIRRKKFYQKNGFKLTNLGIRYDSDKFELMTTGKRTELDSDLVTRLLLKVHSPFFQRITRFYKFKLYKIRNYQSSN